MPLRKPAALGLACLILGAVLAADGGKARPFTLTVIHTNDTHAHHEPEDDGDGGDARAAAVIRQIRTQSPDALLLDAGDRFTGTLFHWKYRGLDNVPVMNKLGFHAMTLGNHEFDEGDAGLAEFIDRLQFPVVSCNVDFSKVPRLAGKVKPYVVQTVAGQPVGLIGLTTSDARVSSKPGQDVAFDAGYARCVQAAADDLARQGVNKIILLSHIGLAEDMKLAGEVSGVDLIVGGHSHTLLSRTYREAKDTYPVRLKSKSGEPVAVVQAGGGDFRYLGRITLEFDGQGVLTSSTGDTVLLSRYITPDPEVQAEVDKLAQPIRELKARPIQDRGGKPAVAAVDLPGDKTREGEALLGDLIADAMRAKADADVAVMEGGGIRGGIEAGVPITYGTVYRVFPFNNTLCKVTLRGSDLLAALEHGVSRYRSGGSGRFLQVSGLRYAFDPSNPAAVGGQPGRRITRVEVAVRGRPGGYERLDLNADYTVACDSFLRGGGDDSTVLRDRAVHANDDLGAVQDVLIEAIAAQSPLRPQLEGRIQVVR